MALEAGIVARVNTALATTYPTAVGGFFAELPKDQTAPGWTYRTISNVPNTTLNSFKGLKMRRLQIDCYAPTAAEVINLAKAIDASLNGFQGNLTDPDTTFVSSCFNSDVIDFFDSDPRRPRRMLEYEILFAQD